MSAKDGLEDYPALAKWYAENCVRAALDTPEQLVLSTCETMKRGKSAGMREWLQSFRSFLQTSSSPLQDFFVAETTMQRCGAELLNVIGDFGETAIQYGDSNEFFTAMQAAADATGLVVFRFLAAWTALNSGHPDVCIEECEKIDDPFSSVHTLHGQALLEIGQPEAAIEALNVATTLSPQELLAWFQKAKALHVMNRHEPAFDALKECMRLAPQSDEIAYYMGMIAVEARHDTLWLEAWNALRPRLKRLGNVAPVTLTLLRLGAFLRDKERVQDVLSESGWSGELDGNDTTQILAVTLRQLGDMGWMDVASTLLGKVTTPKAS